MQKQSNDKKVSQSQKQSKADGARPKDASTSSPSSGVEGEGSYSASRRYDADARDFIRSGKVDEAAQDAKRAIDGPDGPALSEAEKLGKRGPREDV